MARRIELLGEAREGCTRFSKIQCLPDHSIAKQTMPEPVAPEQVGKPDPKQDTKGMRYELDSLAQEMGFNPTDVQGWYRVDLRTARTAEVVPLFALNVH